MITDEICPHCLHVAQTNGSKLRTALDQRLAREQGISGAITAFMRMRDRCVTTMREFAIDTVLAPLPPWAPTLIDAKLPPPPGAEHSRAKMRAIGELRLEDASVRLALEALGYGGKPTEEKLTRTLALGDAAVATLTAWDNLAIDREHEQSLREAVEAIVVNTQLAGTLLESLRRRDLTRLIEASVRRARALDACRQTLGVG